MASNILAALRVWGRKNSVTYKSSKAFRDAIAVVSTLRALPSDGGDRLDAELDARTLQFRRSAALQRSLEIEFSMPHRRSLLAAADEAVNAGVISPRATRVALAGNASRHRRWKRDLQQHAPSATIKHDPYLWAHGSKVDDVHNPSDPWANANTPCMGYPI